MEKKKFFWQKKKEYYQFPLGLRILGGVWSVVWTAVKVALGAGLVALAVVCITGGIFACLMGNYLQEDVIPNAGFNVEDFALGPELLYLFCRRPEQHPEDAADLCRHRPGLGIL